MNGPEREPYRREVRSYVRREGRMTPSQKRALDDLWPRFGIDAPPRALALPSVFGRVAPVCLEVGFGNGDHLLTRAAAEPERNFLGVEVHRPGVGRVLHRAAAAGLQNVKVASEDAVVVLRDWLPAGCLDEIVVYFPDPWPKKRHHKRRLVQPGFAQLAASRLVPDGALKLATDWAAYAEHMREVLDAEPLLRSVSPGGYASRPADRPQTHFEARGQRLGHDVFDLVYRRVG